MINYILSGILSYFLHELSHQVMIKSTYWSLSFLPVETEEEGKKPKSRKSRQSRGQKTGRGIIKSQLQVTEISQLSNTENFFKILILFHNFQISEQRITPNFNYFKSIVLKNPFLCARKVLMFKCPNNIDKV